MTGEGKDFRFSIFKDGFSIGQCVTLTRGSTAVAVAFALTGGAVVANEPGWLVQDEIELRRACHSGTTSW